MEIPDWEAIESAYRAGMSLRDIAAKFGVGVKAIRYRAKKHGWEISPDAVKKTRKQGHKTRAQLGHKKILCPKKNTHQKRMNILPVKGQSIATHKVCHD